jgi:hypothetical protein
VYVSAEAEGSSDDAADREGLACAVVNGRAYQSAMALEVLVVNICTCSVNPINIHTSFIIILSRYNNHHNFYMCQLF